MVTFPKSKSPRWFHLEDNLRPSRTFVHPLKNLPHPVGSLFVADRALDLDDLMHWLSELTTKDI